MSDVTNCKLVIAGDPIAWVAGEREAKLRVNFPPATFHLVFACRPLLSLLIIQLDKPIRERSLN